MNKGASFETPNAQVLKHFAESGLDAEVVRRLHVSLIDANADMRIRVPVDCARIPYFGLDGGVTDFYRLRTLSEWTPTGESKPRKYTQPEKSGNHLYTPPLLSRHGKKLRATQRFN